MTSTRRRGRGEGTIRKRSDGRWEAALHLGYGPDGRRVRRSFYGRTRQEVQDKPRAAQTAHAQGLPVAGAGEPLADLLRRWLEDSARQELAASTFASYSMIVERHLIPALGKHRLAKLEPQHVQAYLNHKLKGGLSPRTVQYHHAVLRRGLGQAERWGLVPRNVARLVSPPKVSRHEVRPLSLPQLREFLEATVEDRLGPLYALAATTGARQGELLGLRWQDVDFATGVVTIRRTLQRVGGEWVVQDTKTAKSRRSLPLPSRLLGVLRAHRDRQTFEARAGG